MCVRLAAVVAVFLAPSLALHADDFAERSAPAPLKFISFNVPRAYPGLPYYTRMAVIGGEYPYSFELVKSPEGAKITADRGDVLWTPKREEAETTFEMKVTDRAGKSVTTSWTVKVTKSGFHFVSPTGDDEKGDGSHGLPWKTVQFAINRAKGTGTIYLREGVYRERSRAKGSPGGYDKFMLMIGQGGYDFQHRKPTREDPFVLSSYPGESATVMPVEEKLSGITAWVPFVVIENVKITGTWQRGVWVSGWAVVRGCEITNVRGASSNCQAVWVGAGKSPELVVQDCHLHDVRQPPQPTHAAGMTLYGVKEGLIEDNHIHDCDAAGINDKDGGEGNVYRGNVVHDCDRIGMMVMGQGQHHDVRLHDNLVYNVRSGKGLKIGLHEHGIFDTRVYHNTVLATLDVRRAARTTVWNCVFQAEKGYVGLVDAKTSPGFIARRTVFFTPDAKAFKYGPRWQSPDLDFAGFEKQADAKDVLFEKVAFTNPEKHDFRLKMTDDLRKLIRRDDYLGAHKSVLKWAADGCPMRNRDNVLERLNAD